MVKKERKKNASVTHSYSPEQSVRRKSNILSINSSTNKFKFNMYHTANQMIKLKTIFFIVRVVLLGRNSNDGESDLFSEAIFYRYNTSYKRIAHKWDAYINKHFPVLYHKYFFH